MKFEVDLTAHRPAYMQIMEQVKRAVTTGELQPGAQLPTVRQLAADLRVNFNTVARGYRLLDEEGIISTQHGRGTYILSASAIEDNEHTRRQQLTLLAEYLVQEAEKLGFDPKQVKTAVSEQIKFWERERQRTT